MRLVKKRSDSLYKISIVVNKTDGREIQEESVLWREEQHKSFE